MKLETFFEKFDQLANAPDVVANMRELVLGLAFTGRLTNKRPTSDGVPDGWENRIIGSIASSMTPGFACSKSHQVKGGHVHLRTHNISTLGTLNFDLLVRIDPQMVEAQKATISRGDILFNNTNSQELVGKTCLVDRDYDYGFSNHITRIRLKDSVDPSFVVFYLTWLRNNGHFSRLCTRWINQAAINTNTLRDQMIPLPPLGEQEQIVAQLCELMALCDRLESQQNEGQNSYAALTRAATARFDEAPTPANLNVLFHPSYASAPADLRKTILNLAIRGKLVPQDPKDEPADELLQRITKARASLLGSGYPNREEATTQLRKQNGQTLPDGLELPAPGWTWATLMQSSLLIVDCHNKTAPYVEDGIPLIRTTNVRSGQMNFLEPRYVDQPTYERWSARCRPEPGDVVITREAPMGEVCIIPAGVNVCLGQRMMLIRLAPDTIDTRFLLYSLMDSSLMERVQDKPVGATVQHLRVGGVETLLVPVPPVEEQRRIVAKVDRLMDLVDQLESQLTASRKTAKDLLDAVVHELLHPGSKIIEGPRSASDRASQRAAIGCYSIEHLKRNPSFGHTMNMKVVYMAQAHIGLPLDLKFQRQAAGPWHPWIEEFDAMGESEGWFTVTQKAISDGHTKYEYVPKAALKQKAAEAAAVLGEHRAEFDRLLGFFANMKTVEAEIVATLFAAWNDFLIDGKTPTDDEIIREVRENWHQSKERFTPALLQRWLDWIRRQRLTPEGHGPRTRQQLTLRLN